MKEEAMSQTCRLRSDDFSWQGICSKQPRFFIRRLKSIEEQVFTDLLYGDLPQDAFVELLTEFLTQTPLLKPGTLVLKAIASNDDGKTKIVQTFDKVVEAFEIALASFNLSIQNSHLNPDGSYFDAILLIQKD